MDRVKKRIAVLIDDDGDAYDVTVSALGVRPREGMVLRVASGADGHPDWTTAVADDVERDRRMREFQDRVARLTDSDEGGDIAL